MKSPSWIAIGTYTLLAWNESGRVDVVLARNVTFAGGFCSLPAFTRQKSRRDVPYGTREASLDGQAQVQEVGEAIALFANGIEELLVNKMLHVLRLASHRVAIAIDLLLAHLIDHHDDISFAVPFHSLALHVVEGIDRGNVLVELQQPFSDFFARFGARYVPQ
jgi:hypothetical protein